MGIQTRVMIPYYQYVHFKIVHVLIIISYTITNQSRDTLDKPI